MVDVVQDRARSEVTDKVAKVSAQVAKTVSASGVIALQKFGFGAAVEEVTQAAAKGIALGAVKSASSINLNPNSVAFQIARGTMIGASKEIAAMDSNSVAPSYR